MRTQFTVVPVAFMLLAASVSAQVTNLDADVPLDPKVEKAIERAQEWLVAVQQPNGSWGGCNGANSLAMMALMVNGTTPGHAKFGTHISQGVNFLIQSQNPNGYLVVGESGNMYQHALATLCLSEAYGMTHNPTIREALTKAIDLIVQAQNTEGGWRYKPKPEDADLSVTVMQVMALRASVESGIYVPKETIERAVKYVKSLWVENESSYGYTGAWRGNFNRAAAGTVCLQSCNLYDDKFIPRAVQYMAKNASYNEAGAQFWYGHYYASVALYHYGGDAWKEYYSKITTRILKDWTRPGHYGDVLSTSWAILVMGVPYRYLPVYQR